MPIDRELLEILRCPETQQTLTVAEAAQIADLNAQIAAGTLVSRGGEAIKEPLDSGLLRADGTILYPVRDDIPEMLIDSGLKVG